MLMFNQVGFKYGAKAILHDVSFSVPRGHIVALVGESGAGKSTVAKLATGLIQPSHGHIERPLERGAVQMIFQSSRMSLSPHLSVFELVAEGLLIHAKRSGLSKADIATKTTACLASVGLDASYSNRYAADLSGGQRQRVNIARAIIMAPDYIIADEPVSALDVSVQAQICNVLKPLVRNLQCGMLMIIHDLNLAEYMADFLVVLKQGRVVEQGFTKAVFSAPQHTYTQQLLQAGVR